MLSTSPDEKQEVLRLRAQFESLRAENARLREENQHLRSALDAHVARANSPALFGPLELSAGTSVGPRRHRPRT